MCQAKAGAVTNGVHGFQWIKKHRPATSHNPFSARRLLSPISLPLPLFLVRTHVRTHTPVL